MRTVNVILGERSYPINIRRGLAKDGLEQSDYIVTDSNIAQIYKTLLEGKKVVVIKPGESSKSIEGYTSLAGKLKDCHYITAFGGGVVGDLTGFIASTLKRGSSLIQVPTTLVAMVDSSIGGKNGINFEGRKNYLGTFYQPSCVAVDPNLLKTLPKTETANGVAEIIKYGAIKDSALLERMQKKLSAKDEDLEEIIARCANIKKYFVELDEKDENIRHALNFGHTIGHALELEYGISHGQAISIGMVYESKLLSVNDDKIKEIIIALEANGLPMQLPKSANISRIIELMKADKKGPLIFAFDENHYDVKVSEKDVRSLLKK